MNDDQFDKFLEREIEQALAVDPAPAFAARVRRHIANRSTQAAAINWRYGVALAAFAALVFVAVLFHRSAETEHVTPVATVPEIPNVAPSLPAPPAPAAHPRRPAVVKPPRSEPAVLIQRSELEGFRQLIKEANDGRIDLSQLAQLQKDAEEIETPQELEVPPVADVEQLRIEPLD